MAAVWMGSCASAPMRPATESEARNLAMELRARQNALTSFAGRGGISLKTPDNRHYLDVMVAAERPDRLRLQTFDFMGRPVMTLTAGGGRLGYLDYSEKVFYEGPATDENLNRYIPLGLKLPDIITLVSGGQPLSQFSEAKLDKSRELGSDQRVLSLYRPDSGLVEKVWLAPSSMEVERVEVGPERGGALYRISYGNYRATDPGGRALPHFIEAVDNGTGFTLTINYKEIRLNPPLPPDLFSLKPPPGVRVEPIPERGDKGA